MNLTHTEIIAFKYIIKDAITNKIYENTYGQKPLEILVGQNQILPELEEHIRQIPIGTEQKIYIEQAYGSYDEQAIKHIPRNQLSNIPLEKNMKLYTKGEKGKTFEVTVLSFDDNIVAIDHNHPLAGKNLIFKVKVVNKRIATAEALAHRHNHHNQESCGCGSGCGCH